MHFRVTDKINKDIAHDEAKLKILEHHMIYALNDFYYVSS